MNVRSIRIAAIGVLAVLFALAPEAEAQRGRRRGGRGGRGGRAAGRALGRPAGARRAQPAQPKAAPQPTIPVTAPKGGELKKAEDQFRAMLKRIDEALAESERLRGSSPTSTAPRARELPADVERGTFEWRALQRPVFMTVDYDGNGWLAYSETRDSLGFDRAEFAFYDRDHDGRISSREFMVRYEEVVAQTGAFRVPVPDPRGEAGDKPSAATMRNEFDRDEDGALDANELADLLARWQRPEIDAASLLEKLDQDRDGRLRHSELATLAHLRESSFLSPEEGVRRTTRPKTVVELFGASTPRDNRLGGASLPPQTIGPAPHFVRLDLDRDGYVTQVELLTLQDGSGIYSRVGAVLAALDLDGDGRLSEREFQAGFTGAPRTR